MPESSNARERWVSDRGAPANKRDASQSGGGKGFSRLAKEAGPPQKAQNRRGEAEKDREVQQSVQENSQGPLKKRKTPKNSRAKGSKEKGGRKGRCTGCGHFQGSPRDRQQEVDHPHHGGGDSGKEKYRKYF